MPFKNPPVDGALILNHIILIVVPLFVPCTNLNSYFTKNKLRVLLN